MNLESALHNPRHINPQTHQTLDKHNQDTTNLRHIRPKTKNIGLSTKTQIKTVLRIRMNFDADPDPGKILMRIRIRRHVS